MQQVAKCPPAYPPPVETGRSWACVYVCVVGGAGGQGWLRTPEYMVIPDGQSHQAALHSALGVGPRTRLSPRSLSTLTARVRLRKVWEGGPTVISCLPWRGLPPSCQALGSFDPWAGQGPTHGALVPTVCNFMSHEKCLKHVKTPCTSVAPSLVRVRMELGCCTCTFGGRAKRVWGPGSCVWGGWAGSWAGRSDGVGWECPLAVHPGQQGASLPQGSDPVFSGVLGT